MARFALVFPGCILIPGIAAFGDILYQAGFEPGEGYTVGDITGQDSWWAARTGAVALAMRKRRR